MLAAALSNLAAISVSGVTSYALDHTPDSLVSAQLPALVILPELSGEMPGLQPNGFSAGVGQVTAQIAHVLLVAPVVSGMGSKTLLPDLVSLIDAYVAALAGDPTLGGALALVLMFTIRAGVVRYSGVEYHGAVFTHTWVMNLGG
ncbi:MAG TPA: hypothetical protein VHP83_02255 [Aggregatilineaceae bacterium]|nr:hypothetical protein [Aggregatilineaceae bacterium]